MKLEDMRAKTRELYSLLPAIHRVRDGAHDNVLGELLDIIAQQVLVLEEDLEQLYDDQFIETCADWVVPYIGDLVAHRTTHGIAGKTGSRRAEVANTIAYRRRKGAASVLEQLARDVTGWPAHVVETFRTLATTQYMNHPRRHAPATASVRGQIAIDPPGTAFTTVPHRIDVRSMRQGGRYNIPNIGIFLWRIESHALQGSPASGVDARRYRFSPLECDVPLFTRTDDERTIESLSGPLHVPLPLSRRRVDEQMRGDAQHKALYYGRGRSLLIVRNGVDVPADEICICSIEDDGANAWTHARDDGMTAVDPERGRIAFPTNVAAPASVEVTFHYGAVAEIGGGEYARLASSLTATPVTVSKKEPADFGTVKEALESLPNAGGVVEIIDNARYTETLTIDAPANSHIELRAHVGKRPHLALTRDLLVTGGPNASVTLDGLLISADSAAPAGSPGRVMVAGAQNELDNLHIRHCTLAPGLRLQPDGSPVHVDEPSLVVEAPTTRVTVERSILGAVRLSADNKFTVSDSAIDALSPESAAIIGPTEDEPGGLLELSATTIIGKVRAVAMPLVTNCILHARLAAGDDWRAPVLCERKQEGCVRFSFIPLGSITPRRHACQPELEIAGEIERRERAGGAPVGVMARERIRNHVAGWLVPAFTSARYVDPAYLQLRSSCAVQIRAGADDESEMGVYHLLYQPQREINLRERLDEYLRFGLEAGLIYAS